MLTCRVVSNRESSKYWHMRASNYLQGSLHGEALACVDLAIRACSKQSLGLLGRYYYLRGKILQVSHTPRTGTACAHAHHAAHAHFAYRTHTCAD